MKIQSKIGLCIFDIDRFQCNCHNFYRRVIFLIASLFIASVSGSVIARDGFSSWASFGVGYGFSFPTSGLEGLALVKPEGGVYGDYLDRTGTEFSENVVKFQLGVGFDVTEKMGVFLYIPAGIVDQPASSTLPGLVEFDAGIGDLYGGLSYKLMAETEAQPRVDLFLSADSNLAKFTSLGDGLWSVRPGIQASKYFSDSVYGLASVSYERYFEKNSVDREDSFSVGGGLGTFVGSGKLKVDLELHYLHAGEIKVANTGTIPSSDSYSITLGLREAGEKVSGQFYLAGLNEDFEFDAVRVGFDITYQF